MRTILSIALIGLALTACAGVQVAPTAATSDVRVMQASEVQWEHLNPARGDKSPRAGTLWGDRKGTVPTGFLVKFVDGFSSPPHIHNITYRGVVISGTVHNDDPAAAHMWMPPGSFWTQPKGEVHITAAKGGTNMAYIEIDQGPYLVLPVDKAFDSGERPVNLDASNIVWVDPPGASAAAGGAKFAYLWGDPSDSAPAGSMVKLPAGFSGKLLSHGAGFRAVVIQGHLAYRMPANVKSLEPGGFFSSKGEAMHRISCEAAEPCVMYVRSEGTFGVAK